MLKITITESSARSVELRFEGRIAGRRLAIVRNACVDALASRDDLRLDLREVSYVDQAGGAFLRRLTGDAHVVVTASSNYVTEVLRAQ